MAPHPDPTYCQTMTILKVPEPMGKPENFGVRLLHALVKVLFSWVPKGSPDYDRCPWPVAYWLVEVDNDGWAEREIGFTAQHQPVLYAPTDRNMGLWTDSDRVFSPEQFEAQNEYPFAATWEALHARTRQVTRSL